MAQTRIPKAQLDASLGASPTYTGFVGSAPFFAKGNVTGNITLDWNNGNYQSLTLTGNTTITSWTAPTTGAAGPIGLTVTNNANYTLAFPTILRSGGISPVITTTSGAAVTDILRGFYDGTNYSLSNVLPNVS